MCHSHAACVYLHLLQGRPGSIQGLSVLPRCLGSSCASAGPGPIACVITHGHNTM